MELSNPDVQDREPASQGSHSAFCSKSMSKGVLASLIFHFFVFSILLTAGMDRFSKPAPDQPFEVRLITEKPVLPKPVKPKPVKPKPLDLTLPIPKPALAPQAVPKRAPLPKKQRLLQKQKLRKPQPPAPLKASKPAPLPPRPRLNGGKIVKKYSPHSKGGTKGKKGAGKPVFHNRSAFKVQNEGAGNAQEQRSGARAASAGSVTQSERDFLLAQILKYWRYNYDTPAEKDFVLRGGVMVMKDGTLAPPFNKDQHWNPQGAFAQYAVAERTGNETVRRILESFYLALRMAQPLVIPSGMKGPWPRFLSLSFRFQDLPRYQGR